MEEEPAQGRYVVAALQRVAQGGLRVNQALCASLKFPVHTLLLSVYGYAIGDKGKLTLLLSRGVAVPSDRPFPAPIAFLASGQPLKES